MLYGTFRTRLILPISKYNLMSAQILLNLQIWLSIHIRTKIIPSRALYAIPQDQASHLFKFGSTSNMRFKLLQASASEGKTEGTDSCSELWCEVHPCVQLDKLTALSVFHKRSLHPTCFTLFKSRNGRANQCRECAHLPTKFLHSPFAFADAD